MTTPPRPSLLPVEPNGIPSELRQHGRWLNWRLEWNGSKWTKVPYVADASTTHASSTDPTTWRSFDAAFSTYAAGSADGVGYALGDGVTGIDLDAVLVEDGTLDPKAQRVVSQLDSYAERSVSGTGVHILVNGTLPTGRRRNGRVEMYSEGRFFTFTGQRLPDVPSVVHQRQAELEALHAEVFKTNTSRTSTSRPRASVPRLDLDDSELLTKARAARNGAKFERLWAGDTAEYPSHSEADLALCSLLAFWTQDANQIDRLFRASGLMRDKWDTQRQGSTYGADTIRQALDRQREHYTERPRAAEPRAPRPESASRPAPSPSFPWTDLGTAETFAQRHRDDVRFDHRRRAWLRFVRHRWEPDANASVRRLLHATIRQRQHDALRVEGEDARKAALKFALGSESRQRIDAALDLATSLEPLADAGTEWDSNPWLLGAPNGIIDLRTGRLRPGRPDDRVTLSVSVPFDPDAEAPRFEQFLVEVFDDNQAVITFVHRGVGYTLSGCTFEQVLFFLFGKGANGKTTFLNVIFKTLGDYAHNLPFSTLERQPLPSIPNDIAQLVAKRFVVAAETSDGARFNEARIKALTGSDPISARFFREEWFTFNPVLKLWLAANHRPDVRDDSLGFWRRMRLIPFERTFKPNRTLERELLEERVGILAWAVRGCLAWQREGLAAPEKVREATEAYQNESDPLGDFVAAACTLDPDAEVRAADFYKHYLTWADAEGIQVKDRFSAQAFGRLCRERFQSRRDEHGRAYLGIARRTARGAS